VAEVSQTRGNIGEWSELYALAYLLVSGGAHAADGQQRPTPDLYFKVLQVVIASHELQDEMRYDINENSISIFENGYLIDEIEKSELKVGIEYFFTDLASGVGRKTFALPSGDKIMKLLHKKTISAGSGERETDLQLVIADEVSGGPTPRYGFSIKSQLGQAATLLNSSGSTNVIYEIIADSNKTQRDIPDLTKSPSSHPQNIRSIYGAGYKLEFQEYQNIVFAENLSYVDSNLPEHLARVLLQSYISDDVKDFSRVSEMVFPKSSKASEQPLFKLRELLGAISMGLRPSSTWKGNSSKFKGLMVVKKDGNLVFYYLNTRLNFEEYLFNNVRFDRPSTSRHKYGQVFEEDGRYFIKLNLQIRFKK
jgi:type II restriction enzyme